VCVLWMTVYVVDVMKAVEIDEDGVNFLQSRRVCHCLIIVISLTWIMTATTSVLMAIFKVSLG